MTDAPMIRVGNHIVIKSDNSFDVARIRVNQKTGEEVVSKSGRSYHGKLEDALEWMIRDVAGSEADTVRQYVKAIKKAAAEVRKAHAQL